MSSEKIETKKKFYIERLIEICGTKQPNELAQILDISYQAARNYLNGRLPDASVLLKISERTSYSIHWLLTGEGEKFVLSRNSQDMFTVSEMMKTYIREQCLEVFQELFVKQEEYSQEKIVKLTVNQIKSEKKIGEFSSLTQNDSNNL